MLLVSVIMPSCNSAAFIGESILSVLQQTHQQLELIVVDDGSEDNTLAVIQSFVKQDERIRVIERQRCSGGPATPRNLGLQVANGDYLAFIDSDDLWHPKKLELQLSALRNEGLDFLSSLHIPFKSSANLANIKLASKLTLLSQSHKRLIKKNSVITSSAFMRKTVFAGIEFQQHKEYVGVEDYLAWLHVHQNNKLKSAILQSPLVLYRLREDSISSSKLVMAKKIFYLLSHYKYRNKPLGWRRYYYFTTYVFYGFMNQFRFFQIQKTRR